MKETIVKSDLTGEACNSPVELTIQKLGYIMKIGNNAYVGPTRLDIDESELDTLSKYIRFEKNQLPPIAAMPFIGPGPVPKEVTVNAELISPCSPAMREHPDNEERK